MIRTLALIAWLGAFVGCGRDHVFPCTDSSQCLLASQGQGTCVMGGCAFPSQACASGLVFDSTAPDHPGDCVPTSSDGGTEPDMTPMGPAPRPIAPLSTSMVTSQKPTLKWQLAQGQDNALVQLCTDRPCKNVTTQIPVAGSKLTLTDTLSKGVYFWRIQGLAGGVAQGTSPTWQFRVGVRTTPIDSSWGQTSDVDGDGFDDLVVGAQCAPYDTANSKCGPGRAYVFKGATTWPTMTPAPTTVVTEPNGANGDFFGSAVATAGDVNGDGYPDVIIGAYCAPAMSGNCGTGLVYVYHGGPMGLDSTPAASLKRASGPPADFYGKFLASAGDVDGDGYADVLIGAPLANSVAGGAYVHRGGPDGLEITPTWVIDPPGGTTNFGSSLASGDFNGDGYSDLVIGSVGEQSFTGGAYVYLGGPNNGFVPGQKPATPTHLTPPGNVMGANFATSIASAGDVNSDGYDDLVMGASGPNGTVGHAYVYLGGSTGINAGQTPTRLDETTATAMNDDVFGARVAGDGDIDGDGYADIVVSATSAPFSGGAGPGAAFFFSGFRLNFGVANQPNASLEAASGANGDRFGTALRIGAMRGGTGADVFIGAPFASSKGGAGFVFFGPALMSSINLPAPDGANGNFGF